MNKSSDSKIGWERFDSMSAAEKTRAAHEDPDALPLTEADLELMRRTPQVSVMRRALGLSQEQFAEKFHIPVGTLRDWEQGRKQPDAAAKAYLTVIAKKPDVVSAALANR